jgi:hypothetical protein
MAPRRAREAGRPGHTDGRALPGALWWVVLPRPRPRIDVGPGQGTSLPPPFARVVTNSLEPHYHEFPVGIRLHAGTVDAQLQSVLLTAACVLACTPVAVILMFLQHMTSGPTVEAVT